MIDYLIVGAGFAGCVLAERLAAGSGKRVLLVDRRPHIAGNAYDYHDAAGVLVHRYGPHIFHTNSDEVFEYLSRFTRWRPYEHRVLTHVDGKLLPFPINVDTLNKLFDLEMGPEECERFLASRAVALPEIRTSEDVVVSKVGRELFEKFFRGYTRKQWGMEPRELDATVAGRIPVRTSRDDRYFTDRYQCMPADGYTSMFSAMVDHPRIDVRLGVDFAEARRIPHRKLVYSGPIDEYYDYCLGVLPYRSLRFEFETHAQQQYQPVGTINYPNEHEFTRVTEFKHLTGQQVESTTICREYPGDEGDPYYPIPRPANSALSARYLALAKGDPDVHFVGRLGTYRYYNMDQVVAQALALYGKLAGEMATREVSLASDTSRGVR